jgi:hypothetical protein
LSTKCRKFTFNSLRKFTATKWRQASVCLCTTLANRCCCCCCRQAFQVIVYIHLCEGCIRKINNETSSNSKKAAVQEIHFPHNWCHARKLVIKIFNLSWQTWISIKTGWTCWQPNVQTQSMFIQYWYQWTEEF